MLENMDLTQNISREEYKKIMPELEIKIGELQRKAKDLNIPVIIVFEGWDAAGKGTLINQLILSLDPRGFNVFPTNPPNEEEQYRPFLWRFWKNIPAKGRIAVFDRSWYGRVLVARVDKLVKKKEWTRAYDEINIFEKQLTDDGTIIVKFFLHISKKEQKKRFNKLLKNSATMWKVTKDDWKHHRQYEKYVKVTEDMFEKTDSEYAKWHVIEAHDKRFAISKVYQIVMQCLENKINDVNSKIQTKHVNYENVGKNNKILLDDVDLSLSLTREKYIQKLRKYQKKIHELEHEVYMKRIPVIIVYQGWDAAGKGGNIKRLVQGMDPRGYEVVPIAAPNVVEKQYHYLWRFWNRIPKAGHITIFDRSWYGRVLVERIEGFCLEAEWQRAYEEINQMEKQLTDFGAVVIKFWLHIDKDEQLRRFEARQNIPYKQWKIVDEDWRNREKWDQYKIAVEDMIAKTSTDYAPWTLIESNCKLYARIKALEKVILEVKKQLK